MNKSATIDNWTLKLDRNILTILVKPTANLVITAEVIHGQPERNNIRKTIFTIDEYHRLSSIELAVMA